MTRPSAPAARLKAFLTATSLRAACARAKHSVVNLVVIVMVVVQCTALQRVSRNPESIKIQLWTTVIDFIE
jgi:hypothetical protein